MRQHLGGVGQTESAPGRGEGYKKPDERVLSLRSAPIQEGFRGQAADAVRDEGHFPETEFFVKLTQFFIEQGRGKIQADSRRIVEEPGLVFAAVQTHIKIYPVVRTALCAVHEKERDFPGIVGLRQIDMRAEHFHEGRRSATGIRRPSFS